ncbi:Uncharacterised protein [uncultured archaeon]|nr:Uncharacterised protein [uncultured archaeon]
MITIERIDEIDRSGIDIDTKAKQLIEIFADELRSENISGKDLDDFIERKTSLNDWYCEYTEALEEDRMGSPGAKEKLKEAKKRLGINIETSIIALRGYAKRQISIESSRQGLPGQAPERLELIARDKAPRQSSPQIQNYEYKKDTSEEYLLDIKLFEPDMIKQATNIIYDVLKSWDNKDNPPFGICYYNPKPRDDFWHLLNSGCRNANTAKILTTTGYTTFGAAGLDRLDSALRIKAKGELKFLLLNPESTDIIKKRVKELPENYSYTIDSYKKEITDATEVLIKFSKDERYNPKIKLRYFHHYPLWRLFIFDDVIAFVQPYSTGVIGDLSPVIGFKKISNEGRFSLFDFYLEYFDKTYEFGKVVIE